MRYTTRGKHRIAHGASHKRFAEAVENFGKAVHCGTAAVLSTRTMGFPSRAYAAADLRMGPTQSEQFDSGKRPE